MVGEQREKPSKFINAVDRDMHDSILRLDQKLKGLQTEINVKIQSASEDQDEHASERRKQLANLSEEVAKAIDSIKDLVNMVISEEYSDTEFVQMNHEGLESLREIFKDNIDKISKLKEQF